MSYFRFMASNLVPEALLRNADREAPRPTRLAAGMSEAAVHAGVRRYVIVPLNARLGRPSALFHLEIRVTGAQP